MTGPLAGLVVGVTADRRAEEQSELLQRRGARVVHAPTIRTLPLRADGALRAATESCIARPPQLVVLSTGLGVRAWLEAAESTGLGESLDLALGHAEILARGPKASGAAVTAGWNVTWVAPSASSAEMLDHLAALDVAGKRVAVQLDGRAEPVLADAVRALGAEVIPVPVYRWEHPIDREPAHRLIEAAAGGALDAVTFTSSPSVWNTQNFAESLGLGDRLRAQLSGPVLTVCVGPICAQAAEAAGFTNIVQPGRARLGSMVKALANHVVATRSVVRVDDVEVEIHAAAVVVAGDVVDLAPRERDVLDVLARRPGSVVTKAQLLQQIWRGEADSHAVEVTVGRLRRRLGESLAIETIPRRGYRLVGPATSIRKAR